MTKVNWLDFVYAAAAVVVYMIFKDETAVRYLSLVLLAAVYFFVALLLSERGNRYKPAFARLAFALVWSTAGVWITTLAIGAVKDFIWWMVNRDTRMVW